MADEIYSVQARGFYQVWNDEIAVFVFASDQYGRRSHFGQCVHFEPQETPSLSPRPSPTFSLSREDAQALMGSLWDAGIRPAHAKMGDGQAKHLEDMRAIAFAKLNVEKP